MPEHVASLLSYGYLCPDRNSRILASVLNAAWASKKLSFLASTSIVKSLLENDPNLAKNPIRLTPNTYAAFIHRLISGKALRIARDSTKGKKGKGSSPGLWRIENEFFIQLMVEATGVDPNEQNESTLAAYDLLKFPVVEVHPTKKGSRLCLSPPLLLAPRPRLTL